MKLPVTLVIPTHNRPHYLERIVDYYSFCCFDILIVDSSPIPYSGRIVNDKCTYHHVPDKTFTQKLADAFEIITTPYAVMCADDDFILPDAVEICVSFLEAHPDYVAAGGNSICYISSEIQQLPVFAAMYTDRLEYDISEEDPVERLNVFFGTYRSIFYSVHRIGLLRKVFTCCRDAVTNLFLNEYLTCIVPIMVGKYRELPVFYQVREYNALSDDKTTINLDTIITSEKHQIDYEKFIGCQAYLIAAVTGKTREVCIQDLNSILSRFAASLPATRNYTDKSLVKKVGTKLLHFPVIGKALVAWYRTSERSRKLKKVIRTDKDKMNLLSIKEQISKYKW